MRNSETLPVLETIPRPKPCFRPARRLQRLLWRSVSFLPDKPYLTIKYLSIFGRLPKWKEPSRFSELIQIRKLKDRNPLYTQLVDKAKAKQYIEERVGTEHVIPTYWVGTDLDTVDWDTVPLPAVIKPTHLSDAGYFLRKPADIRALMALRPEAKWLTQDQARYNREWAYIDVPPRIIIEKAVGHANTVPADYRFWAFDGDTMHVELRTPHRGEMYWALLSPAWELLPLRSRLYPTLQQAPARPSGLQKMLELAEELGRGLGFARLDFYDTKDGIFAGELTLYPGGGYKPFDADSYDIRMADFWKRRIGPLSPL